MNVKKTPLQQVKEDHGGKSKLVDAILALVETGEEAADDAKARLLKASNKKLLRLAASASAIKDKYGSPEKLADFVAQKLNRTKDSDFVEKLRAYSPARLLDLARSLSKEPRRPLKAVAAKVVEQVKAAKAKVVAKKPAKAAAKKPAAKKPAAKKPAAKKTPSRK
jgi:hypothetical protein